MCVPQAFVQLGFYTWIAALCDLHPKDSKLGIPSVLVEVSVSPSPTDARFADKRYETETTR